MPSTSQMERKFNAAVNVIRGLPKNGKFSLFCLFYKLDQSLLNQHRHIDCRFRPCNVLYFYNLHSHDKFVISQTNIRINRFILKR